MTAKKNKQKKQDTNGVSIARPDDYANAVTGLGGPPDKGQGTFFQAQPRLQAQELHLWYEQDALASRLIDRLPDDATREGFTLTGEDESFNWNGVMSELEDLDALNAIADGWRWARLTGGALIVLAVNDGRKFEEPIDLANARGIAGIQVVESTFVQPDEYDRGLGSRAFQLPKHYVINMSDGGGKSRRIHRSRVIRIDGMKISPAQRINSGGWGPSILQRVATQLRQLGEVMGYSRSIAHNISVPVMKFKGLRTALCGDAKTMSQTERMFEAIRFTMDNLHILALDSEDDIGEAKRDVSGLEKLIEKFVDGLVRSTDMPRTILLGEQPGGLGSNSDSEIRAWYDHVHAKQRQVLTPIINRILEIILAIRSNRHEVVPYEWTVEWGQLWQPTAEEIGRTRLSTAQADQIYYSIGAMSVGEIRTRLEADGEIGDAEAPVPPPPVQVNTGSPPGGSGALATADEEGDNLVGQPSHEPVPNDLISIREAAQKFGVPTRTISKLTEEGALSYWQFGLRKQVSLREVAMLGRTTSTAPRSPGAPEDADRMDRGDPEEGLGQPFPKARAEAYEAKLGQLGEIAMKSIKRKVIPAIRSGSDGAIEDAIDDVQNDVDRRFGDDVVEGYADEAGESLDEEHSAVFFAALGLAIGSDIIGGDSEALGIPRGAVLPPPGVAGPTGQPVSRAVIGVRVNPQPQMFAAEFTAESVEYIGVLRAGIKDGLADAIVRAQQFGDTPEETAQRLLKIWEKNGVPSQIPIDRVKKNGERILVTAENHARFIAHDQINKLNGRLNQTRQEAAGITSFIWRTQQDDRVRPAHEEIEGRKFQWAEGAPGIGLPGEPYQCRCTAAPVIDKEQILNSDDFVSLE